MVPYMESGSIIIVWYMSQVILWKGLSKSGNDFTLFDTIRKRVMMKPFLTGHHRNPLGQRPIIKNGGKPAKLRKW